MLHIKTAKKRKTLKEFIGGADAVVIGAGAGLSASAGFSYSGKRFEKHFTDFERKYGFHDMYSGGFYPYKTLEEYWAYWSRHIWINRYEDAPKPVYETLLSLVEAQDYFVLTTNVDHCFQKAGFDKKRLFYTQGDYGLWQCSKACHNKTYDNEQAVRRMIAEQRDLKIPAKLVPRCPVCGAPMAMNLYAVTIPLCRIPAGIRQPGGIRVCPPASGDFRFVFGTGCWNEHTGIIKYPFGGRSSKTLRHSIFALTKGRLTPPARLKSRAFV
ncbi:MAG: Sir2 silent information regulator family NAD-dependent deacetylase [Oscillospiraceae bacterium]